MKQSRVVLAAGLAMLAQALAGAPALAEDKVLARINNTEIRESDLRLAEEEVGVELAGVPPESRRRLLLEFLIEMRLFADAADGEKLTSGPAFEQRLAYWNTRAKRDAYYEKSVKGAISDGELKGIYDDKVKMIPPEEEVDARHVLVETEEQAKEIADKAGKGEDFGKLAEAYSNDPGSKGDGGKLGYFSKGQMVKEFEDAAFALKKGEVSQPVKSQFGWHIIKVEDRRTKLPPAFDDVKDQIRHGMVQQKGQQVAQDLRGKARIEYVDATIKAQVEQEAAIAASRKKALDSQMEEQLKALERLQKKE